MEDEAALLEVARRVLTGKGYKVLTASRGPEAIELASTHDGAIDLLLTDVVMPQMLGKDVAREIKAISPATRVVFMSGYARPVLASQGTLEPGVLLIEKPFTASTLLEGVRAALDHGPAVDGAAATAGGVEVANPVHRDPASAAEELDQRAVDELVAVDGTGEALEAVATLFIRDAPARMAALADAGGRGDAPEVHAAAHTLRGTAATFGAVELAELTRAIEAAALDGTIPGDAELASVRAALDATVSGLGALVHRHRHRQTAPE